jgi:RimJ/RimL family protein N-acetyltransferase
LSNAKTVRASDETLVGVIYISSVIPNFDAKGHFVVFDSVASKRKKLFWEIMKWMFDRYNLHRISAEAPPYQGGVLRFIRKHLHMTEEGKRREAVLFRGEWWPLIEFGITRGEMDELLAKDGDRSEPQEDVQSLNKTEGV